MPPTIKKSLVCSCCGREGEMEGIKANLKVFDENGYECPVCNELPAHPRTMYPALTERQAWVWALKYDLHMKNQAVAEFLNISIVTVKIHHGRAKRQMKKMEETLEAAERSS